MAGPDLGQTVIRRPQILAIPPDNVPDRNAPTATPTAITVDPEPMAPDKILASPRRTAGPAVLTPDHLLLCSLGS